MLVPHAWLWRGVSTRGPSEKASCSSGCSSNILGHRRDRRLRTCRQRRAAELRAHEPAAAFQLAPNQQGESTSASTENNGPSKNNPWPSKGVSESDGKVLGRDDDERQATIVSTGKVLKINIDLMLWRSRTSRIRARQTLDALERKNLYKAAEDGLRRCLTLDPTEPRTYVVLGKTLVQQKRYDEARTLYQEGCANTGNANPYIWSAWGWLEALTGNVERARKLYDAAVVVDGTHACAWHKWGMLEKGQGNYIRARDLWMQGIQRCRRKPQSQNAYLYNALGCLAAQLGRVGEARAWFEEGTRTAEGAASVALWQAWGVLEATQGDPTAVRYLFRKALQANPRSRYVHLAWALWEHKQGNGQQCLALLQRGCQLNPTDPALYQAWALMEKKAGRIQRARQLFEQGLKADPGYIYLWQAYGVLEAEQGNMDRARQLFQEGVWADPRSPDTLYVFHAWGSLEAREGNVQTARELFKAAVRVDPKNETTWDSWIAMESEQGFLERADELRIRRAEQQWEFVVPPGFTTRPGPGILDTLTRFFKARTGFGAASGGASEGAAAGGAAASGSGGSGSGADATAGQAAGRGAGAQASPSGVTGAGAVAGPVGPLPRDYELAEGEQLGGLEDIDRILTGDFSALASTLPDFISPDDGMEDQLRPPNWRRQSQQPQPQPQPQRQQELQQPQVRQQRPPEAAPLATAAAGLPTAPATAVTGRPASAPGGTSRPAAAATTAASPGAGGAHQPSTTSSSFSVSASTTESGSNRSGSLVDSSSSSSSSSNSTSGSGTATATAEAATSEPRTSTPAPSQPPSSPPPPRPRSPSSPSRPPVPAAPPRLPPGVGGQRQEVALAPKPVPLRGPHRSSSSSSNSAEFPSSSSSAELSPSSSSSSAAELPVQSGPW